MTEFVFVTKYALTSGIKRYPVRKVDGLMVVVEMPGAPNGVGYFHGNDWHRNEANAIARAHSMSRAKVASLERQIEKLKKMTFEVPA